MRWLPNISFSSSSSSCSSSSSSNKQSSSLYEFPSSPKRNNRDSQHRSRRGIGLRIGGPRVTRQRKLRHLSDHDISGAAANAAEAASLSRSTSTYSTTSRSSTVAAAVPLPLPLPMPLPEPEGNGIARLPSKKEVGPGKGLDDRDRDRDRVRDKADVAGDGILSNSPQKSVFAGHDMKKTIEHLKNRSPATAHQDPARVENSEYNFWINVPTRSAPTSPFSSPVLSPQRKSAGDVFPQYNMVPKGNQVWSAPEMPNLDISWLPPPAFFDFTVFSSDNSPIQSPPSRSPRRHTKSPSGPSSPLHPKLSLDPSSTRRESANVHPLPLPPGAAMPSLSSSIAQAPPKPEPLRLWQKGKLIGRGTFGSVYVASNRETGALCAMKEVELFPDDPKSAECIKQLEQEIKVLSQLKHPNIVQYYGSEIVDDHFYIYLEYVHPGSINKYIREHCGAITESVLRNFTRHILSGLAYLHSTKTIHRDIKGANLLVDASGVVKLADFGMAKHLTGQRADLSLKGSPYWMAPELMQAVMQKDNNPDLAFAIDIWSLGCTIIEMFTGKPPWSEYEGAAAMFKVMRDTPPIPESLSPEGKDFLRCCFRRNPAERPSACTLLEHRFLKNSQQLDVPSCSQSFHAMKLMDKPQSPRRRLEFKLDHLPVLPSSKSPQKITIESETGQQLHFETPDLTMASRYSPRSTLEALPSPSPLRSAPSMNDPNLSATSPSNISPDPKYKLVFR